MPCAPRNRTLVIFTVVALCVITLPVTLLADTWQPWQKVSGTEISWRYQWNSAWSDYDIEVRNGSDSAVTLKFIVSCGRDTRTAFWSLQPGGVASFLERFPSGSAATRLSLKIVESEKQD